MAETRYELNLDHLEDVIVIRREWPRRTDLNGKPLPEDRPNIMVQRFDSRGSLVESRIIQPEGRLAVGAPVPWWRRFLTRTA